MRPTKLLLLINLLLGTTLGYSQYIQNEKYLTRNTAGVMKYIITYDLISTFDNVACNVKVKLTAQNGTQSFYLKNVIGDVGELVYPGNNKEISWDHVSELIHFSGEINLTLEVEPVVRVSTKTKRGTQQSVTLGSVISRNKTYDLKLFKKGKEIAQLTDGVLGTNSVSFLIPKKSRVGKKYQLAIIYGDQTFFSNSFKIKRKFSFGWIIIPAVGVASYLLYDKIQDDNASLPGPPGSGLPNGN